MEAILRNTSLMWSLFHCIVMFMLLFESRFSKKKTTVITICTITPLLLLNLALLIVLGLEKGAQLIVFTCVLPSFVLFFLMAKHRGFRFIFTFCVVDTITYEIILLTGMLDRLLGIGNSIVMFLLRLVIFPLLEFAIIRYIGKYYHRFLNLVPKGWGIFSTLSINFYVLLLVASAYPTIIWSRPEDLPVMLLICIMMPIIYYSAFRVLTLQAAFHDSANEAQILDMQVKLANERILSDAENESRLKALRHDLRHHMLLLNDYIKNEEKEKAIEHIASITDYVDSTMPKQFCLNGVVNVILSHYANIAKTKGIDFICEVSLSRQLPVSDIDLVVILSNALENAVNALEICDTKRIEIKGFESDGKFFFEVKNPFCGEVEFENDLPVSRRENHGYGTKSIAAIVEKHEGIYSFTVEDDIFVFRCAI